MNQSKVAGAWRLQSPTQEGIAVLSNGHYSSIIVEKARLNRKPTTIGEKEMLESYKTMTAQGGTYKLEGNKIRLNRQLSRGLDAQGRPLVAEFVIKDDKLEGEEILPTGEKSGVRMVWTRLE